jgi:hypothetical protein
MGVQAGYARPLALWNGLLRLVERYRSLHGLCHGLFQHQDLILVPIDEAHPYREQSYSDLQNDIRRFPTCKRKHRVT